MMWSLKQSCLIWVRHTVLLVDPDPWTLMTSYGSDTLPKRRFSEPLVSF